MCVDLTEPSKGISSHGSSTTTPSASSYMYISVGRTLASMRSKHLLFAYPPHVPTKRLVRMTATTLAPSNGIQSPESNSKSSPLVSMPFTEATALRRSLRALEPRSPVPDRVIVAVAMEALLTVPSAFNNQAARLAVLLGADHARLWSFTGQQLEAKIGSERYNAGTKERIDAFREGGYGTILFFDDEAVGRQLSEGEKTPEMYRDKGEEWVQQSQGMHQYFVWVALEALGLGANLQHYNPLIDEDVRRTWSMPATWKLKAQMVFGVPKEGSWPGEREQKVGLDERLRVLGVNVED